MPIQRFFPFPSGFFYELCFLCLQLFFSCHQNRAPSALFPFNYFPPPPKLIQFSTTNQEASFYSVLVSFFLVIVYLSDDAPLFESVPILFPPIKRLFPPCPQLRQVYFFQVATRGVPYLPRSQNLLLGAGFPPPPRPSPQGHIPHSERGVG